MNNGPLNNEFIAIFCVCALKCSIDSANLEVMIIIGTISSSRKRTNKNYQFLFITILTSKYLKDGTQMFSYSELEC